MNIINCESVLPLAWYARGLGLRIGLRDHSKHRHYWKPLHEKSRWRLALCAKSKPSKLLKFFCSGYLWLADEFLGMVSRWKTDNQIVLFCNFPMVITLSYPDWYTQWFTRIVLFLCMLLLHLYIISMTAIEL